MHPAHHPSHKPSKRRPAARDNVDSGGGSDNSDSDSDTDAGTGNGVRALMKRSHQAVLAKMCKHEDRARPTSLRAMLAMHTVDHVTRALAETVAAAEDAAQRPDASGSTRKPRLRKADRKQLLAVTEDMLKVALLQQPSSDFLRSRMASFLMSFKHDRMGSFLWLEASHGSAIDMKFHSHRLKKQFHRMDEQEELGGDGTHRMDTIAYEDMKKNLKSGMRLTLDAAQHQADLWKSLFRAGRLGAKAEVAGVLAEPDEAPAPCCWRGGAARDAEAASQLSTKSEGLLDALASADTAADTAFRAVMKTARNSPLVLQAYAVFVLLVRQDKAAHAALLRTINTVVEDGTPDGGDSPSKRSEGTTQSAASSLVDGMAADQPLPPIAVKEHRASRRLQRLVGLGTFVLASIVLVQLLLMHSLSLKFRNTFVSVNESGVRRFHTQDAVYRSRAMQRAALANDAAAFAAEGAVLNSRMNALLTMHSRLSNDYVSEDAAVKGWYVEPQLAMRSLSVTGGVETAMLSGDEAVTRFAAAGLYVSLAAADQFVAFAAGDQLAFLELYYVLENYRTLAKALDQVTGLYQLEVQSLTDTKFVNNVLLASAACFVELALVLLVVRPTLNGVTWRRLHSQKRLLTDLQLSDLSAMRKQSTDAYNTVLKSVQDEDDAREMLGGTPRSDADDRMGTYDDDAASTGGGRAAAGSSLAARHSSDAGIPRQLSAEVDGGAEECTSDSSSMREDESSADEDGATLGQRLSKQRGSFYVQKATPQPGAGGGTQPLTSGDGDDHHPRRSDSARRRLTVRIVYITCLVFILVSLSASTTLSIVNTTETSKVASHLNNGGRARFLGARVQMLAKELCATAAIAPNTLRGSGITDFNSTDVVRTQLRTTVRSMIMLHDAMLYGRKSGWETLPAARGWPRVSADTPYSMFTDDARVLAASFDMPPSRYKYTDMDTLMFRPSCLTDLPYGPNAIVRTEPRLQMFTSSFSPSKCVFYQAGDPMVSLGLHRFIEDLGSTYLGIADLPDDRLRLDEPLLLRANKYADESAEWALGMGMTIIVFLEHSLQSVDATGTLQSVMCALCIATFVVQAMLLVVNMRVLVNGNVAQHLLVDRLVKQAKATRRLTAANRGPAGLLTRKNRAPRTFGARNSVKSAVSFVIEQGSGDCLATPVLGKVKEVSTPPACDAVASA